MSERFLRNEMILGPAAMERLAAAHVCVFGLGGVGSYVVECLARAGVGELTLVDRDTYGESNLNRQLGALCSTLGRSKAEVLAERVQDINPDCQVHPVTGHYDAEHREAFWASYDYAADCIDLVSCKIDLILTARERQIPILSALGTGNKLDPSRLEITDLSQTKGCPLARVMRRELRRRGVEHLKVVYSSEEPASTLALEAPPPGRRSVPASVPWVPSVAGLLMGSAIVTDLISHSLPKEESI
ncbi:MAG: tRNA threonylcarbamoyladenosine dehydratase [Oscillospiraceae bacterium]|jgi:tRNA A37 threonylcarbamoyladenosine dehydratase|nr:tRNA threonylcarbamoyladenosine dehydratase [Oscillospiraceae bacterium]MCI9586370.1 tRNA threonylcarbamoyladenosine dehydratase [Oscillospiraceae bacterium]